MNTLEDDELRKFAEECQNVCDLGATWNVTQPNTVAPRAAGDEALWNVRKLTLWSELRKDCRKGRFLRFWVPRVHTSVENLLNFSSCALEQFNVTGSHNLPVFFKADTASSSEARRTKASPVDLPSG